MLIPVIGLVQVGEQGHADRYTYLPHIGLFLLAVCSLLTWQPSVSPDHGLPQPPP